MTKDEFIRLHPLDASLAILALDEADDLTSDMYQLSLEYRDGNELDFFYDNEITREEFFELMDYYADIVIARMKQYKIFIRKMRKAIKE